MCIGLGNVWRFPYLCYKNGGGVFLIAYVTLLAVFVVPTVILELTVGQYTRCSGISVWKLVPICQGVGYAAYVVLIYSDAYYPIILAWSLRWLVAGLSTSMPWTKCDNEWNSENCISIYQTSRLNQSNVSLLSDGINGSALTTPMKSSVEEFWLNRILDMSGGIEEMGGMNWELALCLLAVWLMVYFSIWKGVGWTSKVVYVTATLPIVMIIVVLVRGVTLSGASTGIIKYLNPDITKLADFEVWTDAANQVVFSFIIGYGGIISLASHNKYHHNLLKDALIVTFANAAASFMSGFAIFSVLGHLAEIKNTTIDEVAESGPGLVFMVYPTALSFLPLPNLWIAIFFVMLIFLGFDTLFVLQDGIYECTTDIAPRLKRYKWNHEIVNAIISGVLFLVGLSMVTNGGIYVLHIFNTYSGAGWCMYFIIFFELLGFAWLYGASRLCDNMHDMLQYRIPRSWLIASWKFTSPLVALLLLFYSVYNIRPLVYDRTYYFPTWASVIAWLTALSSVLLIPITALYVIKKSPGKTLMAKLRNSTKPLQHMETEREEIMNPDESRCLRTTRDSEKL